MLASLFYFILILLFQNLTAKWTIQVIYRIFIVFDYLFSRGQFYNPGSGVEPIAMTNLIFFADRYFAVETVDNEEVTLSFPLFTNKLTFGIQIGSSYCPKILFSSRAQNSSVTPSLIVSIFSKKDV